MAPQSRRTAPAKSPYSYFYWILAAIALVGIAWLVFTVVRSRSGGSAAMAPIQIDSTNLAAVSAKASPHTLGSSSAPVKLVEFADYTCPYCGEWAAQVQPRLVQDYVNTGKLQIVFYEFPLGSEGEHKWAFLAARAARCAGEQGKFWEMHDKLFGSQSQWTFAATAPVKTFEGLAASLGLDGGKFNACLESDRYADAVTASHVLGEQLGVDSTPTIIINQRRLGEREMGLSDYDGLKRAIAEAGGGAAK